MGPWVHLVVAGWNREGSTERRPQTFAAGENMELCPHLRKRKPYPQEPLGRSAIVGHIWVWMTNLVITRRGTRKGADRGGTMRPHIDINLAATVVDKACARWATDGLGWGQKDMEKMGRAEGKLCHPTMIVSEDRPDASRNVQNRGATTNSQWRGNRNGRPHSTGSSVCLWVKQAIILTRLEYDWQSI